MKPTPLGKLVDQWSIADVAVLSGIAESTISRLWDDPQWLDRIKGGSLRALLAAIPGLDEYATTFPLVERRRRVGADLAARGVPVDGPGFMRARSSVPEQYLINALGLATTLLDRDIDQAAAQLPRFWGQAQDGALAYLLGTGDDQGGLLQDPDPVLAAAIEVGAQLARRPHSFHAVVARASLGHHLARTTRGDDYIATTSQSPLAARSVIMGKIIANNDLEVARDYCKSLNDGGHAAVIESWAFPTYTHDAAITRDFSLPRGLVMRRTALEVIREVGAYGEANLYYLAAAGIPTILERDSTFGSRAADLVDALDNQIEQCHESSTRDAVHALLRTLRERPLTREYHRDDQF